MKHLGVSGAVGYIYIYICHYAAKGEMTTNTLRTSTTFS